MSGKVSSLPTSGLAHLQSQVESQSKATRERGRQWIKHRQEYQKVKDRLEAIDGKLQYDVMVPLTSKAMMPGKLVHTNEILALLGDNWFVETSAKEAAKIAGRRIEECDEMLRGLEEEMRLNEGWRDQTKRMEGEAEGAVDIREEYKEEEEKKWREKHVENVRREKKEGGKEEKEVSDGELWSRLEELEVREALEEEWAQDEESDEDDESDDEEDENSDDDKEEQESGSKQLKRRVSWGNLERPVLDDGLKITFSHSDAPCPTPSHAPLSQKGAWPPQTPGDVGLSEKKPSKSILKPASASTSSLPIVESRVPLVPSRSFPPGFQPQQDYFSQIDKVDRSQMKMVDYEEASERIVDYVPAISEVVVEKNVGQGGVETEIKEPKRVSRFKASRANK